MTKKDKNPANTAAENLADSLNEVSESAKAASAQASRNASAELKKAAKSGAASGEEISEFAKRIWLAGLGAYGKAFDEAQALYGDASKKGDEVLDELISRGKKLEEDAVERLASSRQRQLPIEERIEKMRQTLGFGRAAKGPKRKAAAKPKSEATDSSPSSRADKHL